MDTWFYTVLNSVGYGHPLHPVLTHMVVGPVIAALVFGLLGLAFRKEVFYRTARHMTVFAFIFWFPTVGVGLLDWQHFQGGADIPQVTVKMILAGILFVFLVVTILLNRKLDIKSPWILIAYLLSAACVAGLGYAGGSLVFPS